MTKIREKEVQRICRVCMTNLGDVVAGTHVSWEYCDDCALRCPLCSWELQPDKEKKRYETLSEHVEAPNRLPSFKTGWGCVNTYCPANHFDLRWLDSGEGPYGGMWVDHRILFHEKNPHPPGTMHYKIEEKRRKEERLTFTFKKWGRRLDIKLYPVVTVSYWKENDEGRLQFRSSWILNPLRAFRMWRLRKRAEKIRGRL